MYADEWADLPATFVKSYAEQNLLKGDQLEKILAVPDEVKIEKQDTSVKLYEVLKLIDQEAQEQEPQEITEDAYNI
jgi:hypothetical protein